MPFRPDRLFAALAATAMLCSGPVAHADEIGRGQLPIIGRTLELLGPVETSVDVAVAVQTRFGGRTGGEAPAGMSVIGDLTGPGIDQAIRLVTAPGQAFQVPALSKEGEYALENVRLLASDGTFIQYATPSFATIVVRAVLKPAVTVRQLTADELRQRGIHLDERNFDVYEYTFVFGTKPGEQVVVPYPVIVDRRSGVVVQPPAPSPYALPQPPIAGPPPRFQPPSVLTTILDDTPDGGEAPSSSSPPDPAANRRRPTIPAAIVLPTGFGVLHQHFAVILNVTNNASPNSTIRLQSVEATLDPSLGMRVSKVTPAVSIGQAVPIRDASGNSFLIAGAEGSAEWVLEALKSGTHTVTLTIRATYQQEGQADVLLSGRAQASIVVNDPRFQINFVHPDVVRAAQPYTAHAFITNTSESAQMVRLDTRDISACTAGYNANNICLAEPLSSDGPCRPVTDRPGMLECQLAAGSTTPIVYKLKSKITGRIFASAGSSDAPADLGIALTMGVSETGIPLSPATLVLPHYAQYVHPDVVDAHLGLLGLGYSLATAPLTPKTAALPRVIRNDVFLRAQDIARAGQRVFIRRTDPAVDKPEESRDAMMHLALDLLGNVERIDQVAKSPDLGEWDRLRRTQEAGRIAARSIARELERTAGSATPAQFVADFAKVASHRSPFALILVHGSASWLTVTGATTKAKVAVPSEAGAGWERGLPYAELNAFTLGTPGELALIGRWTESVEVSVRPSAAQFGVEILYPGTGDGALLHSSFTVTNASPDGVKFLLERGVKQVMVSGGTAIPLVNDVAPTPLEIAAAAQDLFLDDAGHVVSILFNRPVNAGDAATLRNRFALWTSVPAAGYNERRKNAGSVVVVPGASIQDDARIVNVTFDKALSSNAAYRVEVDPVADLLVPAMTYTTTSLVPRIDNRRPAGIVHGRLLRGDGTVVTGATVQLTSTSRQYERTSDKGEFLFEFVPRDVDNGISGNYELAASAEGKFTKLAGTVRLPGEVQRVDLVFLGRGTVQGTVRTSDGKPVANATITIGNTAFNTLYQEFLQTATDAQGFYRITDVPVGPLTIAATNATGAVVFAANLLRTPGEVLTRDLVFELRQHPGFARVRVTVRRSDQKDAQGVPLPVPGARVGVYTQGYGLVDGLTDGNGQFIFERVPSGFISILAAEFNLTRQSAGVDLDVKPDTFIDQTLVLDVPTATEQAQLVTISGNVTRDDPAAPGDTSRDTKVRNAVVTIRGFASVTADENGRYVYPGVPGTLAGKKVVDVYDPETGRRGSFSLPNTLTTTGENNLPLRLSTAVPQGTATLRVRLLSASGTPVTSGYRVIWPGFPPDEFTAKTDGMYERTAVRVPAVMEVWAVPVGRHPQYGDQVARGTIRADFDGQIATIELRLPGHGTIPVRIEVKKSCSTAPCAEEWQPASGTVAVRYAVWDETEQDLVEKERLFEADGTTLLSTATQIPAGRSVTISTVDHPAGYASKSATITYDNQTHPTVALQLSSLGAVSGRVFSWDGQTPVAGALVELTGANATFAPAETRSDGSFVFNGVAADQSFRLVARVTQDGIFRTGFVDGRTPKGGGPAGDLHILLQKQAAIEGTIVDATGAPLDRPYYWVQELSWPYRTFGTAQNPLEAAANGQFRVANIFLGGFRISARSRTNPDLRGDVQGVLDTEGGDRKGIVVAVGGAGTGSVAVTVYDASFQRRPNAEVTLYREGTPFDITMTNANGVAYFRDVPAGSGYSVRAFARAVALGGKTRQDFSVNRDLETAVQVTLDFLGEVKGTLVDADSATPLPVIGAPVKLNSGTLQTQASTSGSGAFAFIGVPEGRFSLEAIDLDSGRTARSDDDPQLRDVTFIDRLTAPRRDLPPLKLEKTAKLNVKVYLPNDTGGAGVLAPLVNVKVTQPRYSRESQSSDAAFEKMFARDRFTVVATEIGGENRTARLDGQFAAGTYEGQVSLVFAQSGTVQVTVRNADGTPATDAQVTIGAPNRTATLYTPNSGVVSVSGLALGSISVQAVKGSFAVSTGGKLESRSTPLALTVTLGNNTVSLRGFVEAEEGTGLPSAGTRVMATVNSASLVQTLHLETRTDANGIYHFHYIPSGSSVRFGYLGPDDVTSGGEQTIEIASSATGILNVPPIKLDATPPRVLAITPENNANSVSPNSRVIVVFNEPIALAYHSATYFTLTATDDGSVTAASVAAEPAYPNRIHVIPSSLLKSNVVYTLRISDAIRDLRGNKMKSPVGSSFTTVDYTEPKIVRVEPPVELPIAAGTTFRLRFNKPVVVTSGTIRLERLSTYKGQPVETIATSNYLDPVDPATVVVAPSGAGIAPASFYRITASGFVDTQTPPNAQKEAQLFEFFSYDGVKPVVVIAQPAGTEALVAGRGYTALPSITDEGTGSSSSDIAYVEWFVMEGSVERVVKVSTAPFGYTFVAPKVTSPAKYTLKASATDLSGNTSAIVSVTWDVNPNQAPGDVTVTATPGSVYLGGHVDADVTFRDDDVTATVSMQVTGKKLDGTAYVIPDALIKPAPHQTANRGSDGAWSPSPVRFSVDLPADLKEGEPLQFTTTVRDPQNQSTSQTATVSLLADAAKPQITSLTPAAETSFKYNESFTIQAKVKDAESGVARAVFTYDGKSVEVKRGATGWSYDAATGIHTFSITAVAGAKNSDTRVPITATAYDYSGNSAAQTVEVIYLRLDDPTIPRAAWITPLDGAALPANQSVTVKLRVRATDNEPATLSVAFSSSAFASAPAVTRNGDVFEATASLTVPAAGTPVSITAKISDSNPDHDVILPINIDPIAIATNDPPAIVGRLAITSSNVEQYKDRNVVVSGRDAVVHVNVPLTVKNLLVLDGAVVSAAEQTKLDLTVAERLYVDGDSRVDVTEKGYLGGWRAREDGTKNESATGMTLGGTATGGATSAGSHAGIGAEDPGTTTNATYGSIAEPSEFGSGGAGAATCCNGGGNGGGVAMLRGAASARFVVAGAIRADGGTGVGRWAPGAGGSIVVNAPTLITGAGTRITANGGDDEGAVNATRGGGGGRIAVTAISRLDLDRTRFVLQARGGRNGSGGPAAQVDGGAGTILLRTSARPLGELIVSAEEETTTQPSRLTRATPLSGTLTFDTLTVGPRALARFDNDYSVTSETIDPTALRLKSTDLPSITATTVPAAGGNLIQYTDLSVTWSASTVAGLGVETVRLVFSPAPDVVEHGAYAASISAKSTDIRVPATATTGGATLKLRVTDRAGRTAETAVSNYTIVSNTPPTVKLDVTTPASLQMFAGRAIEATLTATDDVAVTSHALTSSVGTVSANGSATAIAGGLSQQYSVQIPPSTPSGTVVALTASASDGFPGRSASTDVKSVTILKDANLPSLSLTSPASGATYEVSSTAKIPVRATAVDNEVAVKEVWAVLDGVRTDLTVDTAVTGGWKADLPVPQIDSTTTVSKEIVVYAKDYEGNVAQASVTVTIKPVIDPNGPVMTWVHPSAGAMFPAAYQTKVRVTAVPASADNGVTSVAVYVPSTSTTASAATSIGNNQWEATITIPAGADGEVVKLKAVATTIRNNTATIFSSLTIVSGREITADTTISPTDRTWDGGTLIVKSGTVTIDGPHTFKRLVVLDGAKVTHSPTTAAGVASLTLGDATLAPDVYVSAAGAIDVTGRGYAGNVSYPGVLPLPGDSSGGSHIGLGAEWGAPVGPAYGSVYQPREAGAGGNLAAGGGVIRINARSLQIDGRIAARGADGGGPGAGGSIWLTATTMGGSGIVDAGGGNSGRGAGGGGAIAVELTDAIAVLPALRAGGGTGDNRWGGAGTVYVRQPGLTYGRLIIDNLGRPGQPTELPSLGSGSIVSTGGVTATLDRSTDVPPYFERHWVEIRSESGALKGVWRISAVQGRTITLAPNGNEPINLAAGDRWQGAYRLDDVYAVNGETIRSKDLILLGNSAGNVQVQGPAAPDKYLELPNAIAARSVTVSGNVSVPGISAESLTVRKDATLTMPWNPVTPTPLTIDVVGLLAVEAGGAIDVSRRGYGGGRSYPGVLPLPGDSTGGSHMGRGAEWAAPVGPTFGSVHQPNEAGAGGQSVAGGGIVRITAGSLLIDGQIRANGGNGGGPGAGGSIRISTGRVSGSGTIEANGGSSDRGAGGGGAVAIAFTDSTSVLPILKAIGGSGNSRWGGAGTIHVKGTGSAFGDLTVDNGGMNGQPTELPALGSGSVVGVNGGAITLDRANTIPAYFEGHWVEFTKADGTARGTWRIRTINDKTITLAPNGTETIDVVAGDKWQGLYRFDSVKLRSTTVKSPDKVVSTNPIDTDGSKITATSTATPSVLSIPSIEDLLPPAHSVGTDAVLRSVDVESTVDGGETIRAKVVLSAPAPPAGAVVMLTSSDSLLRVPATVLVPAGQTFKFVELPAGSVDVPATVTLTATYGATVSVEVEIRPGRRRFDGGEARPTHGLAAPERASSSAPAPPRQAAPPVNRP
ncbi:MAG TPA: carboxypeptidase regulatory-like domain-containing protein [Thermoanaerobaculia bacterium]|nr:carboxypeptidase regulatory-like domain-containing protein [Thermoanaerobaculia bacterium]